MKTPEQTEPADETPPVVQAPPAAAKEGTTNSAGWRPGRFDAETGEFTPSGPGQSETYTVTPRAGPRVAGTRAKAQQDIELTTEQAASELLAGSVVHKGSKLHPSLLANAKPKEPENAGEKTAL